MASGWLNRRMHCPGRWKHTVSPCSAVIRSRKPSASRRSGHELPTSGSSRTRGAVLSRLRTAHLPFRGVSVPTTLHRPIIAPFSSCAAGGSSYPHGSGGRDRAVPRSAWPLSDGRNCLGLPARGARKLLGLRAVGTRRTPQRPMETSRVLPRRRAPAVRLQIREEPAKGPSRPRCRRLACETAGAIVHRRHSRRQGWRCDRHLWRMAR
jgi:hypothetical protein